jgi:hypothetical protein
MKDERHTIDDLFKNRLYDVESDVQPKSWDDISKKINTKSSFFIEKWFYGIGLASTVIAVVIYVVYTDHVAVQESKEVHPVAMAESMVTVAESATDSTKQENMHVEIEPQKIIPAAAVQQQISTLDERKILQLPDGSEVILNRNSSISYSTQFISDRTIYVSGEVYVKVAANRDKKFVLISNLSQIEASESSFIIKSEKISTYDEIFVSTGKIDCKSLLANANRMIIFAGNKAVIDNDAVLKQSTIQDVNYNDWVTQKIIFNNTALNSVFEILEQYYNVSLKADNAEIMNCHFTGTFERNNIDEILQVLSVSFNLSFNQKSKEYILSGKGCK